MRSLASSRLMLSRLPVSTKVLPASGTFAAGGLARLIACQVHAACSAPLSDFAVVLLLEERVDVRRDDRADVGHFLDLLLARLLQLLERAEVIGQRRAVASPTSRMPSA